MNISSFYKDKVVLVTGSSMGIGKELVKQVLENGGKAVITARDAIRLQKVEKEFEIYKDSILVMAGDISNFEICEFLVKKTIDRFGKLDVLITNAGFSCYGDLEVLKPGVARQVIDINIYGSLFPIMTAIQELKKTKGSVLFISSLAGLHGLPGYSSYSLSKMALKALAESARIELKSDGVFIGISYVGFTENEDSKKTINPYGDLESVPERPKRLVVSREATAMKLLRQIVRKKHSETHTSLGKITAFMSRYFPFVLRMVLTKNYQRS